MEVTCGGHEHFPIAVTNEIINLPVDNLFEQCFSDSVVFRKFAKAKKTTSNENEFSSWDKNVKLFLFNNLSVSYFSYLYPSTATENICHKIIFHSRIYRRVPETCRCIFTYILRSCKYCLALCSATVSVVLAGICHRNEVINCMTLSKGSAKR